MKRLLTLGFLLCLISCSSVNLVDTWKNPEIDSYEPTKILLVGVTPDKKIRKAFEKELQKELELRNSEAVMSITYFETSATSEEDLKSLEYKLLNEGFDTILFTKTIGVENKIVYKKNFDSSDGTMTRFKDDYLKHQAIYTNPDYYNEYQIYHAETAMYCICPTKERELIWKGYIDIIDPQDIDASLKDYVKLVIAALEAEQLITPLILNQNEGQLD